MINEWYPQLMIDGHEMGAQDTFLMGPPRQPLNKNIDTDLQKWAHIFAKEQAEAFDKKLEVLHWESGLKIFIQVIQIIQNFEAVCIFFKQSRMAEDGVRRPEGTVQTYKRVGSSSICKYDSEFRVIGSTFQGDVSRFLGWQKIQYFQKW